MTEPRPRVAVVDRRSVSLLVLVLVSLAASVAALGLAFYSSARADDRLRALVDQRTAARDAQVRRLAVEQDAELADLLCPVLAELPPSKALAALADRYGCPDTTVKRPPADPQATPQATGRSPRPTVILVYPGPSEQAPPPEPESAPRSPEPRATASPRPTPRPTPTPRPCLPLGLVCIPEAP